MGIWVWQNKMHESTKKKGNVFDSRDTVYISKRNEYTHFAVCVCEWCSFAWFSLTLVLDVLQNCKPVACGTSVRQCVHQKSVWFECSTETLKTNCIPLENHETHNLVIILFFLLVGWPFLSIWINVILMLVNKIKHTHKHMHMRFLLLLLLLFMVMEWNIH